MIMIQQKLNKVLKNNNNFIQFLFFIINT